MLLRIKTNMDRSYLCVAKSRSCQDSPIEIIYKFRESVADQTLRNRWQIEFSIDLQELKFTSASELKPGCRNNLKQTNKDLFPYHRWRWITRWMEAEKHWVSVEGRGSAGFGKCSRFVRTKPVALTRPITVPAGATCPPPLSLSIIVLAFLLSANILNEITNPPAVWSATYRHAGYHSYANGETEKRC